jgi:hypothetical protein
MHKLTKMKTDKICPVSLNKSIHESRECALTAGLACLLNITNGPTNLSEASTDEIQKMRTTHQVLPLHAYSVDGKLLNPSPWAVNTGCVWGELRSESNSRWHIGWGKRRDQPAVSRYFCRRHNRFASVGIAYPSPPLHTQEKESTVTIDSFDDNSDYGTKTKPKSL